MEDMAINPHLLLRGVEGTLDTPLSLPPSEDRHLVQIRSFGIGFQLWIRTGRDLSL